MATTTNFGDKVGFIWSVADLLRGPYKPAQYGDVMLPLTVLRRLDCVLKETKPAVLEKLGQLEGGPIKNLDPILNGVAGQQFHNRSKLDFETIAGDPNGVEANLLHYARSFSTRAREILEYFGIEEQIQRLAKHDRLFLVVRKFCEIDLHPSVVDNHTMGTIFEELIRRFKEQANEQAGDHFTPRDVIRLMVKMLFASDEELLKRQGIVRKMYDPACGTGGMLSIADEYLRDLNPTARLILFGQEYNEESYAICGSDMLIKGQQLDNIKYGNSFTQDGLPDERFDYLLANPPFGVEWKTEADFIRREHQSRGFGRRFGAGLPRINDGSLLFLQHMISKMRPPSAGGSRIGIVFNGSPLFTGDAGSGESNIRRWILENDWLEAIVALPDQLFYNTGISTYIWIVTNRKTPERRGKVQLIDATSFFQKMRRSLGNKRNEITDGQIAEIARLYRDFQEGERVRIFDTADFGYRKVTIERPLRLTFEVMEERLARLAEQRAFAELGQGGRRGAGRGRRNGTRRDGESDATTAPSAEQERIVTLLRGLGSARWTDRADFEAALTAAAKRVEVPLPTPLRKAILAALGERDETAAICRDARGKPEPDPELRDTENVPLKEDVVAFFEREVRPHVPDAWINEELRDEQDGEVGRVGYEINFNRYFYRYVPPRPLEAIEIDIKALEREILKLLREVAG